MSRFFSKLKGDKTQNDHLVTSSSSSAPAYQYAPPPGAPPSSKHIHTDPARPEPAINNDENPPPYHDWTVVPDTSLLPPPPPLPSDQSTTSNASYDDAAKAHDWCARYHVYEPQLPNERLILTAQHGAHDLDPPPGFKGQCTQTESDRGNELGITPSRTWYLTSSTATTNPFNRPPPPEDQIHMTRLPIYFAALSNPLLSTRQQQGTPTPYIAYFEITPIAFTSPDATVSLGYAAKPYPTWRQPGWHRASVGVHSDDGRRYTNDSWGGRDFVSPFRIGESLGLAIAFYPEAVEVAGGTVSDSQVRSTLPRCKTKVWFTRNGTVENSWDMDEERDAERDEGTAGLYGDVDLYAAIGTYGDVVLEVRFFPEGQGFVPPPLAPSR